MHIFRIPVLQSHHKIKLSAFCSWHWRAFERFYLKSIKYFFTIKTSCVIITQLANHEMRLFNAYISTHCRNINICIVTSSFFVEVFTFPLIELVERLMCPMLLNSTDTLPLIVEISTLMSWVALVQNPIFPLIVETEALLTVALVFKSPEIVFALR